MSAIFGGSKSSSSSSNKAYDSINSAFSPLTSQATAGANALQALLGGDASGFNNFKLATGFDANAEEGSRGITGNAAASGLLRSGSTGKALQAYGNQIQNQYVNDYINNLLKQAQLGFNAGGLMAGAGNVSTSTSSSKPGLGGFIGAGLSGASLGKSLFARGGG